MAAIKPTPAIFKISVKGIFCSLFISMNKIHIVEAVNKSLYHTIIPSFKVISLPSIPVNPARKTAIWSWRKAFFIDLQTKQKKGIPGNIYSLLASISFWRTLFREESSESVFFTFFR